MRSGKIIFVTGTDTGVGKTLLTSLLLSHLRSQGVNALAMKPFCSGGRQDVELLQSLQAGEISDAEMNPFYFQKPVAPLVELRERQGKIKLQEVLRSIRHVAKNCDVLLVEGSGGLFVPLGEGFMVSDIISKLPCKVLVAARNRLGTINHTLLTFSALRQMGLGLGDVKVVLMQGEETDPSCETNATVIAGLIRPVEMHEIPFLGRRVMRPKKVAGEAAKLKKILEKVSF